ncbi:MAG: hypothetical protein QUS33_10155 [Dehalococcoidia bacterium]|nr:hypothetical protein [Dehalococcoidia bacterium]
MDMIQLMIENLGMLLAQINEIMSHWIVIPANATGPSDPSITLTVAGENVVWELASAALGISSVVAEALEILF